MDIVIQKYGGTSVNTLSRRNKIAENLTKAKNRGLSSVIVVSAMGRSGDPYATDTLINLLPISHHNTRNMDLLISCGEVISSVVVASYLIDNGFEAVAVTGRQAGIVTDERFGESSAKRVDVAYLNKLLSEGKVPVVTGFQGVTESGEITTLGRGGSDTSAILLGIALGARQVEIFTDVDGIMTADPKIVPDANIIQQIDYDEVFNLAKYGAKVIHPKAVDLAMKYKLPIKVYNTENYEEENGTLINGERTASDKLLTAIANEGSKVQWRISGANPEVFKEIAENSISIDMINVFKDYSVFITNDVYIEKLIKIFEAHDIHYNFTENCCKVTIIGSEIRGVPGVMSRVLTTLENHVDILQTSDSHTTISILVSDEDAVKSVNLLHSEFML